MNISILSRNSSIHAFRGIGKYTKLATQVLPEFDKQNNYSIVSDFKDIKHDCDILFIPDFTIFKLSVPVFTKVRHIVVTVHDLVPIIFPQYFPAGIKGSVIWQIQKYMLINRVSRIITDSIVSKKDIIKKIPGIKDKINVIYPIASDLFKNITDKKYLNQIRLKYKLPETFVLYVGDANWNKNVPLLVKSAIQGNYNLVLVGKAFKGDSINHPWNKSLNQVLSMSKNTHNIYLLGYVDDSDLVAIYNLAKVYVQPSTYEGFGLPVLEAMKSATPVLASKIGSLVEIGEDNILYFDPNSIEDLSKNIEKLLSNPKLLLTLSSKSLERSKFFNSHKFVKSFVSVFDRLSR